MKSTRQLDVKGFTAREAVDEWRCGPMVWSASRREIVPPWNYALVWRDGKLVEIDLSIHGKGSNP